MLESWTVLVIGLAYLAALFAVATWGDRLAKRRGAGTPRPVIYALSIAVYCTSWTYFGSVGAASRSGLDFLPIYIGPILVFALGWRVLQAIAEIAKRQNIASIADFISARYGKSEALGALVAVVAALGVVPYISIQLKAVSASLEAMITQPVFPAGVATVMERQDGLSVLVAVTMGAFAILFGTRHIDTTEHQDGMILAISVESIVKLVAFLAVGLFVTLAMLGGVDQLAHHIATNPGINTLLTKGLDGGRWFTLTLLAALAIVLLPRQFHVAVVENAAPSDIRRAAWLFPLYLVAINIFVLPIAIAGILLLPASADGDLFVLNLPASAGSPFFTMVAFIGGLSASTAMVVVETIALSIMICNNLVVPLLLRQRSERPDIWQDMGKTLITIRRLAIAAVLVMAYGYFKMIGSTAALAQVGLISFAAVAQFAPAFFGAMIWKRATARGAMAGILAGTLVWGYTLLLPSFADAGWIGKGIIDQGPFGISVLRPRMLLNMHFDPLTHGVLWSLLANLIAYVGLSYSRMPSPIERIQAASFVTREISAGSGTGFRLWRTSVTVDRLEQTVARYLGEARAKSAFADFLQQRGLPPRTNVEADIRMLRFAEHLLAKAVGIASSRLVMALLLERHSAHPRGAMQLLDDASAAIQHNRDLLQSAIDNVEQGIAVFDAELNLSCWNANFQTYLQINSDLERVGTPMPEIMRAFLRRTQSGERSIEDRLRRMAISHEHFREYLAGSDQVLEVRSNPIPDGGVVVTFIDATQSVRAAEALQKSNEELERRVASRTGELTKLNIALAEAKAEAEAANIGKTRFIAAASHDILQSLNAARLFTSSLVDRLQRSADAALARNVDSSLEAVEEILAALLDISRLDAGAMQPEVSLFRIDELLESLTTEYGPAAASKKLGLRAVTCSLTVETDRKLLRRVLQNFVSNAVKYTRSGRVLIGCRRRGNGLRIEVHDTGIGIPEGKQDIVFQEFQRLGDDGGTATGLGLGLSIVNRVAHILGTDVTLNSTPGRGSMFAVTVPVARVAIPKLGKPAPRARPGFARSSTVLVIDNEPAILEGMNHLLTGWGCKVYLARGGAEAVAAFDKARDSLEIILADYHLDGENGIAVIQDLRRRARRPLPAILITADRSSEVADHALAHDIHMLRKPVKPAALRAAMGHIQGKVLQKA
jgi:Na+/proline symporter/nitrogen-specific signal transduction histidine kinase